MRYTCLKGGKGFSRAHRKGFKLDLKGERDKSRLTRDKPGGSMPMFEGWCASKVLQSAISVKAGDGEPCDSKDTRTIDGLETMEGQVGIRASPLKKVTGSIAQLKCIYTNARSMGNKQEELEAIDQWENHDTVPITETCWDDNWNAAMDGYKLFRRDRQGRRGSGVALYVRECFDYLELDDGDDRVECFWVRIGGKANKADIMVGSCYRPRNQD
ncbi:maestro heat-like repeat-containing protein family member 7 [Grus japonensis]|uniref:Maestro heat-like repeat-containing protein family member 7 n=1 Tax=Grus japonensis TaxID=30415 RepID=A0ABC9W685_GRUJA